MMRSALAAALVMLTAGCAASMPQGDEPRGPTQMTGPVEQVADLEGQLLAPPPGRGAEQAIAADPERLLPLAGFGGVAALPTAPLTLPPAPDSSEVLTIPIRGGGARREYQVQVGITPSLVEAEELKERLAPLLEGEEVFIMFTRPYYRVRVGHEAEREGADRLLARLQELGYARAMVIPVTITPRDEH